MCIVIVQFNNAGMFAYVTYCFFLLFDMCSLFVSSTPLFLVQNFKYFFFEFVVIIVHMAEDWERWFQSNPTNTASKRGGNANAHQQGPGMIRPWNSLGMKDASTETEDSFLKQKRNGKILINAHTASCSPLYLNVINNFIFFFLDHMKMISPWRKMWSSICKFVWTMICFGLAIVTKLCIAGCHVSEAVFQFTSSAIFLLTDALNMLMHMCTALFDLFWLGEIWIIFGLKRFSKQVIQNWRPPDAAQGEILEMARSPL